jgi:hypothetical protein
VRGRRVPDGALHDGARIAQGEYGLGVDGYWYVCLPNGSTGRLGPAHRVAVHADETISVYPSIEDPVTGWHGRLEQGEWLTMPRRREVVS